jgi:hypothetical protein
VIRALFVFVLALAGGPFFAWWWPAAPGLLAGFWKPKRSLGGFFASLIGGGAAWAVAAAWLDARNGGLLAGRVAPLFHLPGAAGLIAATAVAGGVTAGLGALLGARFRRFWASLHEALSAQAAPVPDEDASL